MHPMIQQHQQQIIELCERFRVRSLTLFGSAARGSDFDTEASDVDFLIEFSPNSTLQAYFGLRDALADLLGRSVDLIDPKNIDNPYLLRQINQEKKVMYEA